MTADMSLVDLLLKASIPVQLVMLLLILASLMSWSIIFTKRRDDQQHHYDLHWQAGIE